MIELGMKAKDTITGFTGTITGKCEYISGCIQFFLTPKVDKDGKTQEGDWFDHQRIEPVGKKKPVKSSNTGGPQNSPPVKYNGQ